MSTADRFKRPYPTIFLNAFPKPVKKQPLMTQKSQL